MTEADRSIADAIRESHPDAMQEVCNAYNAGLMLTKAPDIYMHAMLITSIFALQDNYGPSYVIGHLANAVAELKKECN